MNLLILVSGLPCTGKTTLGKKLAERTALPFISRDDIKESLFNSLGCQNREWSKKLGAASYSLLYYLIESLVSTEQPLIVENNFQPKIDQAKFLALKNQYRFKLFQIHLLADSQVLKQRFKIRAESGERHPGHVDWHNYTEFQTTLVNGGYEPLDISDRLLTIDTTNFATINMDLYVKLGEQMFSVDREIMRL